MFATAVIAGAGLALTAAGMAGQASAGAASSKAQLEVQKANLARDNANRNTERFIEELNNKKKAKAVSENLAKARENLDRTRKTLAQGTIQAKMQAVEGIGAYVAHSAMLGQQGGSVDALETSMRFRDSQVQSTMGEASKLALYDQAEQIGAMADQGYSSISVLTGGVGTDMTANVSAGPNYAGAIGGFLMSNAAGLGSVLGALGQPSASAPSAMSGTNKFSLTSPASFFKPTPTSSYSWNLT